MTYRIPLSDFPTIELKTLIEIQEKEVQETTILLQGKNVPPMIKGSLAPLKKRLRELKEELTNRV